jgi:hypothetical protein
MIPPYPPDSFFTALSGMDRARPPFKHAERRRATHHAAADRSKFSPRNTLIPVGNNTFSCPRKVSNKAMKADRYLTGDTGALIDGRREPVGGEVERRIQMRKTVPLVFALVLLAGVCLWSGCRISETTVATEGSESGQAGTQNTAQWAEGFSSAPTLEQLGVQQYPASELDEDETVVVWEPAHKSIWYVYHADQCPVVNVAAFFRESLRGMTDLQEIPGDRSVTFKFKTADGVPMMIEITPQDPNQPEGPSDIDIYVNP